MTLTLAEPDITAANQNPNAAEPTKETPADNRLLITRPIVMGRAFASLAEVHTVLKLLARQGVERTRIGVLCSDPLKRRELRSQSVRVDGPEEQSRLRSYTASGVLFGVIAGVAVSPAVGILIGLAVSLFASVVGGLLGMMFAISMINAGRSRMVLDPPAEVLTHLSTGKTVIVVQPADEEERSAVDRAFAQAA
ncbi:MAG: hypothetical protein AAF790_04110 [Planctomycetota bacterium]